MFIEIPRYNTLRLCYLSQFYIQVNETNNTLSVTRISSEIEKKNQVSSFSNYQGSSEASFEASSSVPNKCSNVTEQLFVKTISKVYKPTLITTLS